MSPTGDMKPFPGGPPDMKPGMDKMGIYRLVFFDCF